MSTSDLEDLRRYAATGCEEDFAQVVRRHVDMVYSAARRQVAGDADLAEEVTQRVFIVLAGKASKLTDETLLGGWLINTVRFVARDVLRKQRRRQMHEQKAAEMAKQLRDSAGRSSDDPWNSAEELLDEALSRLGPQSRGMLVLRYFEGKSTREVGQRLGISEDAARKRISRAVDELREMFSRRGVVMSSAALVEGIAAHAVMQAPAELAASAASAATASGATSAGAGAAFTFKAGVTIMAMSKAKMAAAAVIGLIAMGGAITGVQSVRHLFSPAGGARTVTVVEAGPKLTGTVRGPDGNPAAGASVYVATAEVDATAYPARNRRADAVTDEKGAFVAPRPEGPYALVAISPLGYAEASSQKLAGNTDLQLQPWGRIEGVLKVGPTPQPRAAVRLWRIGRNREPVEHQTQTTTDAQGRFVFPRVAPGGVSMYRLLPGRTFRSANWQYVHVEPGKVSQVDIGGRGGAVVGRIETPPALADLIKWADTGRYTYDAQVRLGELAPRPEHDEDESPEEYRAVEEAFAATPEGKLAKEWMFGSAFTINPDGTFRIDDLPPGKYKLNVRCFELDEEVRFQEDVARAEAEFEVPAGVNSAASAPIELGSLVPVEVARIRPGAVAPDFSVVTLDGSTFNSTDHKGKPMVLVFWGTFSNTDRLKGFGEFAKRWGKDERLTILGCFTSRDVDEARQFIAKERLNFPHTNDPALMSKFESSWPGAVVVGRDGKILKKHLHDEVLEKYVRIALDLPPDPATTKKAAVGRN